MNALELLERSGSVEPASESTVDTARRRLASQCAGAAAEHRRLARFAGGGRRLGAVAAAAVVASGALTAWAVTNETNPRTNTTIECGYNTYIPVESGNPLLDCHNALAEQGSRVPPLVGWITSTGLVAVLPAGEKPPQGSIPLPKGFRERSSVLFVNDITNDVAQPTASTCTTGGHAEQFGERVLALAGLVGWQVRIRPASGSCLGYTGLVEPSSRTLTLIAASIAPSSGDDNPSLALDRRLRRQLGTSPHARCVSPSGATALADRDAAAVGIAKDAMIISQAGQIGVGSPRCAIATLDAGGGTDVTIWVVPASSR